MKFKTINLILGTLAITGIMALSGCSSTTTPVNTPIIQSSVDPIVINILTSLNNNDYTGLSQDFSQTMKNAKPQSTFAKLYNMISYTAGDYQSKEFKIATTADNIFTIQYYAQYNLEPPVYGFPFLSIVTRKSPGYISTPRN
jgi:hypothetical protein